MAYKRKYNVVTPSPCKKRRTLYSDIRALRRDVRRNKPELRQESYTVTVGAGTTSAIELIDPTFIDNGTQEFKLHRITVNHAYVNGDFPWGIIYAPREGFNSTQLPNSGDAHDVDNFLEHLDRTKQRVFLRKNFSSIINSGSSTDELLEMDKRFSIPMRIGLTAAGGTSVAHNQLYWIGGYRDASVARAISVTIWYTAS